MRRYRYCLWNMFLYIMCMYQSVGLETGLIFFPLQLQQVYSRVTLICCNSFCMEKQDRGVRCLTVWLPAQVHTVAIKQGRKMNWKGWKKTLMYKMRGCRTEQSMNTSLWPCLWQKERKCSFKWFKLCNLARERNG